MDFSNRHTNEFVNLCDLENVLGGVSVCYAGGNTDSELLLRKSLKNIVIPDSAPESEVGEWINEFVSCHFEHSEAIRNSELTLVNSELKNPTHYSQFTTHCISIGGVK